MINKKNRNKWLLSSDQEFLEDCEFKEYQASGPGGQKRNRKYSGARLTHLPSGIQVVAADTRSLNRNKSIALKKLRKKISIHVRCDENLEISDFNISLTNPSYPVLLAIFFDALYHNNFFIADAAKLLNLSTGKFLKIIGRDNYAWQVLNEERKKRNLKNIRKN